MPSAANVKIEKQVPNSENALPESSNNSTPVRQMITLVEHKIRNLEKRKSKLESYRDLQNAGKELNADQKTAVAKYNEVMHTLEFSREIYKQFLGIAVVSEKEAKKLAKKEAAAKNQAELARLREILLVQDALNQMGNETVRDDFLHGRNGAAQLSETDLKLLDDLYPAVTPKHEAGNPTAFTNEVQTAAEHLLAVVDGKPKEVFGGTYSQVKEVLGKIHESGYFDQVPVFEGYSEEGKVYEGYVEGGDAPEDTPIEPTLNHIPLVPTHEIPTVPQPIPQLEQLNLDPALPPHQMQPLSQPVVPPLVEPPVNQLDPNLPPQDKQQIFYQQPPPPQNPQQPPRPIAEMLGTGSFFFLQESEIDTPPEQIPTQTFTNQSFAAPPPPQMALPPLFQNIPNNTALPPQGIPPPNVANVVQQQPQQPVNNNPVITGNNGIDNSIDQPRNKPSSGMVMTDDRDRDIHHSHNKPPRDRDGNRDRNRSSNNHNNQSYYQNNNGYNSRPRQNRNNGPRSGNNRHNN